MITNAYQELLNTSDGIALWASGIILVDRYDKANRQASIRKAERVINLGGNVMIFPEGVWNMSENLLVIKLYSGIYRIADLTKAPVIPISTMMYEKMFYVSRGEAVYLHQYAQKTGLTVLRDSLATLKWEIMEKYGRQTRDEMLQGKDPLAYWTAHLEDYIAKQTIYEREEENHAHFMDKADIERAQSFEHLLHILPNYNNAFLFNKRLYPPIPR